MKKIKKGDDVIVIAGKDKGKQGTVSSFQPDGKCFVTGIKWLKGILSLILKQEFKAEF